jgi:Ran GTPase-activating protein (RanGAP) involved in mRNA processing and transport
MAQAYIKTIHSLNNYINTTNWTKICELIKNNELRTLCLYSYKDINYYKQLFELLKINTSVIDLWIDNDATDEYYKLLSDCLMFKTNLERIGLSDNDISIDNCKLLCDALKNSTSLNKIHFSYDCLNDNSCKCFIDFLKFNKTVKCAQVSILEKRLDGIIIAKLLNVNTTINELVLRIRKIKNMHVIKKAIKNNQYITCFSMSHYYQEIIIKYCVRNQYNQRLKAMMIQDL